jgi:hypothetical protein
MFDQPEIPLTMPRLCATICRDDSGYWSVPIDAVHAAIDVLRAYIAEWEPPQYTRPADEDSDDLVVTVAAAALAALLRARAANHRAAGLDALLQQIEEFFWCRDARAWLEDRTSGEHADISAALIALYDQRQKQLAQPTA